MKHLGSDIFVIAYGACYINVVTLMDILMEHILLKWVKSLMQTTFSILTCGNVATLINRNGLHLLILLTNWGINIRQ